jgi:hypothetical protein
MRGQGGYRSRFLGANANLFAAVATIFRRQHEFLLKPIVITFRPAVISTLFQFDNLLGGLSRAFLGRIELRQFCESWSRPC